jgi:hypothetical protein
VIIQILRYGSRDVGSNPTWQSLNTVESVWVAGRLVVGRLNTCVRFSPLFLEV